MVIPYQSKYLEPSKRYRRLSLLQCIKKNPHITQKRLGQETNLSGAMVNNYVKELIRDELLVVSGKSNRNMVYHLTPKGRTFVTDNFLYFSAEIVQLYSGVRQEIMERLAVCYEEGIRTVILYGASDTAEVVYSAIQKVGLKVTGIVDSDAAKVGGVFWGQIVQSPDRINDIRPDALLITSFARQNEILSGLEGNVDKRIEIKVIARI